MSNRFDTVWGLCTKRFHETKNTIKRMFIGKKIAQIEKNVNEYYPHKLMSRNAKIFKDILEEMYERDRDLGNDGTEHMGYTRKALYYLAGKWLICLYDFDRYYAERIDYALWLLVLRREELYLSRESLPEFWYPYRNPHSRYMRERMDDYQDANIKLPYPNIKLPYDDAKEAGVKWL